MQWTNASILEFLHYLQQEPCIWHPRHHAYKDRVELSTAWSRIQANMSIRVPVVELKRKRESLMATFRSITSKMRGNTGPNDENYRTNWFAYDTMVSFLGDLYKNKHEIQHQSYEEMKVEMAELIKEDDSNASICEEPLYFDDAASVSSKASNNDVVTKPVPALEKPAGRKRAAREICACELQNKDECSLYTQLLAKKLRGFDEATREVVMHEIDSFVFEAKRRRRRSWSAGAE